MVKLSIFLYVFAFISKQDYREVQNLNPSYVPPTGALLLSLQTTGLQLSDDNNNQRSIFLR